MQKFILLISTIAISSVTAYAQSPFTGKFLTHKYESAVPTKIKEHIKPRSANKTTGIMWRIASYSSYEDRGNGLMIVDSSKYKYSNARGSEFDYEQMFIDDWGLYNPINSDTSLIYSDNGSGFEPSERYTSDYNSNKDRTKFITEDFSSGKYIFSELYDAVYNSNGDITIEYYAEWDAGNSAWDTTSIEYYTYDSQNYLIKDSAYDVSNGHPAYVYYFTNDMNGNITKSIGLNYNWNTSKLDTQVIFNMGYYSNNQLKVDTFYYIDSGKVAFSYIDSFGYNNTDFHVYNETKILDTNTMTYYKDFREIRTLNSLNLPATQKYSSYDTMTKTWEGIADAEWEYTSFGEPKLGTGYQYTNGTRDTNPVGVYNIYYEHFFPVNINDLATDNFSVYPNPAKGNINFISDRNIEKATLYNVNGQAVLSTVINNATTGKIWVDNLTPGSYFIVLDQAGNTQVKQQIIITD